MIILGIDPGLARVGIGIVQADGPQSVKMIDACTIETKSGLTASQRLQEIADDLATIIDEHRPDLAVIETLFFETNRKTAMDVAQARGVILLTVEQAGISILEPTPMQLKQSVTGDGSADKKQMLDMLQMTFQKDLSALTDDAVDALGLALYGCLTYRTAAI